MCGHIAHWADLSCVLGTWTLEVVPRDGDRREVAESFATCTALLASQPIAQLCSALELAEQLHDCDLPVMTTFNGADRVDNWMSNFFGRPNTWGMRYSNILLQQADLIIALGTRLGMQQTGFNWEEFAPLAHLVQVVHGLQTL